jgi:hypothetical protein
MKKEDLDKRIEELEEEQKKKDKAPKTDDDEKAQKLMDSLDKIAAPGVAWGYVSKEVTEAGPQYLKIHLGGKKVKDKDVPEELNKRAETYMMALGYKGPQGREFYGQMIRSWLEGLGHSGRQQLSELEEAIKRGDEVTALQIMQQAYQANVTNAKHQTTIMKVQNAPTEIREKTYLKLTEELGGEQGDLYKVVESLPQAFMQLQKKKAILDEYKKAA